jgi:hypothetical protein
MSSNKPNTNGNPVTPCKDGCTQVTKLVIGDLTPKGARLDSALGGDDAIIVFLARMLSFMASPHEETFYETFCCYDNVEISFDVFLKHFELCGEGFEDKHDVTLGCSEHEGVNYISIILSCKVTRQCKYIRYKCTDEFPTQEDISLHPQRYNLRLSEGHVVLLETLHQQHRSTEANPGALNLLDGEFFDPRKMGYLISLLIDDFTCLMYDVQVGYGDYKNECYLYISLDAKEKCLTLTLKFKTRRLGIKFLNDTREYMLNVNIIDETDLVFDQRATICVRRKCTRVDCPRGEELVLGRLRDELTHNDCSTKSVIASYIKTFTEKVEQVGARNFFYSERQVWIEHTFLDKPLTIGIYAVCTDLVDDGNVIYDPILATVFVVGKFDGAIPYKRAFTLKSEDIETPFKKIVEDVIPKGVVSVLEQRMESTMVSFYVRQIRCLTGNLKIMDKTEVTVRQNSCWLSIADEYGKTKSLPDEYAVYVVRVSYVADFDLFNSKEHILVTDKVKTLAKYGGPEFELIIMPYSSSLRENFYEELVEEDGRRRAANMCNLKCTDPTLNIYIDYMHEMFVPHPAKRTMTTSELIDHWDNIIGDDPAAVRVLCRKVKEVCSSRIRNECKALGITNIRDYTQLFTGRAVAKRVREKRQIIEKLRKAREEKEAAAKEEKTRRKEKEKEQERLKTATLNKKTKALDAAKELEREKNLKSVYAANEAKLLAAKEAEHIKRVQAEWTARKEEKVSRAHILRGVDAAIVKRHEQSGQCPTKKKCHCRHLFESCPYMYNENKEIRKRVKRREMGEKMFALTTQFRMSAGSP